MSKRIEMLRESLVRLASDAAAQLDYLRKIGVPDGIDELALDYDAIAAAAGEMLRCGELNSSQYDCISRLNEWLQRMSGCAKSHLWTPEALYSAQEWRQVRTMAIECINELNRMG